MICYYCNRIIGTRWVTVCPLCGNDQVQAQNLTVRGAIEDGFARLENDGTTVNTMIDDIDKAAKP